MSAHNDHLSTRTVCARLTPAIASAIATVAVHGPKAVEVVATLVNCATRGQDPFPLGRVRYGLWNAIGVDSTSEQVVVCRTAENQIEIHCHGGNAVCQMIANDLKSGGCEIVSAFEFPSDFNGEIACEAAIDLPKARTDRVAAILLDQLNGALADAFARIENRFQKQGPVAVRDEVESLLSWSELGRHLVEPWQVVLAGPPNSGKSSLVNAIAGSERSIVHAEPGTTRDWVEVLTAVDGWPVSFSDTAGVRESSDAIESEGIRRSVERVVKADLVLLIVDATVGWTATHESLRALALGKRTLVVWNKVDLLHGDLQSIPRDAVRTSVCPSASNLAIDELLVAIGTALVPTAPEPQIAIPFRERHMKFLEAFLDQ